MPFGRTFRVAARLALVAGVGLGVWGCGVGGGGDPELASRLTGAQFAPSLPTRIYAFADRNTADFYLTDLPPEVWTGGADVSEMTGSMVHVHMFLASRAGRTPIEPTASSATIRVVVLGGGTMGVYGGGGFLLRSGEPGDSSFGGAIRAGTMRLLRATPGFVDRLGPCEFKGSFQANLDASQAANMQRAFEALVRATTPLPEAAGLEEDQPRR